jgi:hypothetical protein
VDRAVQLAADTQRTTSFVTNRQHERTLVDRRNRLDDGRAWAFGLTSINLDNFEEADIRTQRLKALDSYFTAHPGLIIGIKLAHPHQAVRFDDANPLGAYESSHEPLRRGVRPERNHSPLMQPCLHSKSRPIATLLARKTPQPQ